jgi:hypothetical protein
MYPKDIIRIFSIKANEILNETFKVVLNWDTMLNEQRAAMGLAALHRMTILADELPDIKDIYENAFPSISMEEVQRWKNKLWEIIDQEKTLISPDYEETDMLSNFVDGLELDDEAKSAVKESAEQLTKRENEIQRALPAAISRLMDLVLELEAATREDRTKHNALLYTNALGRYHENHWKAKGPKEIEHLIRTHCPWDSPATESDLKNIYNELHGSFVKTTLGRIYEDNQDDEVVIANLIAASGCTPKDLQDFFHDRFMLEEIVARINQAHSDYAFQVAHVEYHIDNMYTGSVVNKGTLINKPGASINLIDKSGLDGPNKIAE